MFANFVGMGSFMAPPENSGSSSKSSKNCIEMYFDDVLPLFETHDKEKTIYDEGIKVLTFHYQLPEKLPASVESTSGFVRYAVHVCVDVDGETIKNTEYFSIMSKTNVNENPSCNLPGIIWQPEKQCIFQSLLCSRNHIRAFVHIPKQGYVPGEYLFVNAEISNFFRQPIEWVKASLIQIIKYKGFKSLMDKRVVSEITRGSVMPFKTQAWRSEGMIIPAIPPTSSKPYGLVTIKYRLLFQYKPSWQRKHIELKQNVFIGAVQLVQYKQGRGEGEGAYNSQCFNGSNLESCIFGPHSISDESNDVSNLFTKFSPLYPVCIES
ncbi:hypothetical protein RUM44_005188 [Polyplax serrata]|uniref:Arrestin C-terminal-like domain-containing protein n=1 Tax=Polyplax serrata TaxID=468196 RepID=A0ABR1AEB5_POLSC